MNKRMRRWGVGLGLAVALSAVGAFNAVKAQGESRLAHLLFPGKVKLAVSANSDDLKNLVSSYILRELRDIKDVEISEKNSDWEIQAIAVTTQLKNGTETGYALSWVVLRRNKPAHFIDVLGLTPAQQAKKDVLEGNCQVRTHQLVSMAKEEMRETIEEKVANFDVQCLEPLRKK